MLLAARGAVKPPQAAVGLPRFPLELGQQVRVLYFTSGGTLIPGRTPATPG